MKRSLGKVYLTHTQLQTIIVKIEAALNSRPLTCVGSDLKAGNVLTPNHFCHQIKKMGMPLSVDDDNEKLNYVEKLYSVDKITQTWKHGQRMLEKFWKRCKEQYLLRKKNGSKIINDCSVILNML